MFEKNKTFELDYKSIEIKYKVVDMLENYLKDNNITQQEFADKIGTTQQMVSKFLTGKVNKNSDFELLLRKRSIRSLSGIVSVQVLTKPYPCPSRCIFCPNDPDMPKRYIKAEPGAMRARLNQFDPIKQVYNRLYSLKQTGHKTDKIEMIVLG